MVTLVPVSESAAAGTTELGQPPVDRAPALLLEQGVDPAERPRAEEAAAGRQRRRVHRLDPRDGPSIGFSDWASRPQRIAASGPPRAARASIARSVTVSQPRPRWAADLPGCTVRHRLSSSTPWSAHGRAGRRFGRVDAEVVDELAEDVDQARRQRPTSGATEKLSPTGWPGRRVGVLARRPARARRRAAAGTPQHVVAGRQVAAPGGDLLPQEPPHRLDRRPRPGPAPPPSPAPSGRARRASRTCRSRRVLRQDVGRARRRRPAARRRTGGTPAPATGRSAGR